MGCQGLGWSIGLEEKPHPIPSPFGIALGDAAPSWDTLRADSCNMGLTQNQHPQHV